MSNGGHGICHACGKRLYANHKTGTVGGNAVKYHLFCFKILPKPVTAQESERPKANR